MFTEFPKTFKIALPIVISNLSYVGLGLIDSAMIGVVDYRQLAASSLVINVISLPQVLGMGMGMALSPLTAMANGQNDEKKLAQLLFNGVVLSFFIAIVIALLLFFNADLLFHLGQDHEVATYSISFFKLISLSLIPMLLFTAIKHFCDGLEYTKTAMVLSIISLPLNAFLNWIFIYGNLGFPRMELTGAGYGTLITRILITITLIIVVLRHHLFSKYIIHLKENWKIDFKILSTEYRLTSSDLVQKIPNTFQFGAQHLGDAMQYLHNTIGEFRVRLICRKDSGTVACSLNQSESHHLWVSLSASLIPRPRKKDSLKKSTLLAERHHATIANAIVSVGFTPAGRQLTAT